MALNMPHDMYMAVRDMLPPVQRRIRMVKHNKHPVNAARGREIGATKMSAHELIYVWKKGGGSRRRVTRKLR